MYKMILADGTTVEFSELNGTNFVVDAEMDVSIFSDENLKAVTVKAEDGQIYELENLAFIQQQKRPSGKYYIAFREKSQEELDKEEEQKQLLIAEEAIIELYEMITTDGETDTSALAKIYPVLIESGSRSIEKVPEQILPDVQVELTDGN